MTSNDENKQKIIYYLLAVDGPVTDANLSMFIQNGEKLTGFVELKGWIIAECVRVFGQSTDSDARYNGISERINSIADSMSIGGDEKKKFLWTLASFAWYDGKYTPNEKKLIHGLAQKWKFDPSFLMEMEDSAETLVVMENYRNWIKTTSGSYEFINSIIQELDKNQKDISNNIACTINLG